MEIMSDCENNLMKSIDPDDYEVNGKMFLKFFKNLITTS